jgi:predicted DNA-binding transcriptional regulator YafY
VYHAFGRDEAQPRDVEPIRLVHLSDAWYLAAYCRLRQDVRLFRLDRIDALDVLDEQYIRGPRHAVSARMERDVSEYPEARVRFDPAALRWVRERQPFVLLREEADTHGPVFVYALRDERELLTWLLTWGRGVEVVSPPSLRHSLAEEARAMLARHSAAPTHEEPAAQPVPAT